MRLAARWKAWQQESLPAGQRAHRLCHTRRIQRPARPLRSSTGPGALLGGRQLAEVHLLYDGAHLVYPRSLIAMRADDEALADNDSQLGRIVLRIDILEPGFALDRGALLVPVR